MSKLFTVYLQDVAIIFALLLFMERSVRRIHYQCFMLGIMYFTLFFTFVAPILSVLGNGYSDVALALSAEQHDQEVRLLAQPRETLLRSQQRVVDRMGWHQAELLF